MASTGVTHVHCHFATHPALAGFIVHRLTGIPFSFTAAGSDLHVDRTMLCTKASEAAFVVAISDFNKQVIVDDCGEGVGARVRVIRSGIETEFFRPRPGERAPGPLRIVSVGRLIDVKGQTYLIEACRRLAADGVDFVCDAGLGERVRFLGSRSRSQIARLLAESDVFVTPSVPTKQGKREGIPIVLMEALAAGVPAVATRISGIPELVEDGRVGLLVPPRDAKALAAALARLAHQPELRSELGRAGRAKVVREYDAYANAATLTSLFNTTPVVHAR
jgi:glycosyltransferase involved in cell wall biosynthesis